MQVYVQKLTTTTFPRRSLGSSCAELSQSVAPRSEGKCPSTGSSPLRPINPPISPSEVVDVEDGVREGPGRFLRQVVADTALDRPMFVLPGELRRVGARVRMGRAVGVTLERDRRDGDDGPLGEPPFEIVVTPLAFREADAPAVVVDHDVDVIGVFERRGAPLERRLVE